MTPRWLFLATAVAAIGLATAVPPAHAQSPTPALDDFNLSSWTEANGLPAGRIRDLTQDAAGYLWIASDGGLVRFDGLSFELWNARLTPTLPTGPAGALLTTADGSLWIGLSGKTPVGRIRGGDVTLFGTAEGLAPGYTRSLLQDHAGVLWTATSSGLYWLDAGRWHRVTAADGLPEGATLAAFEDSAKRMWVGTTTAIYRRKASGRRFERIDTVDVSSNLWQTFSEDTHGRVFTSDFTKGYRTPGGEGPVSAKRGWGATLLHDRRGNFWVGTLGQGLWRLRREGEGEGEKAIGRGAPPPSTTAYQQCRPVALRGPRRQPLGGHARGPAASVTAPCGAHTRPSHSARHHGHAGRQRLGGHDRRADAVHGGRPARLHRSRRPARLTRLCTAGRRRQRHLALDRTRPRPLRRTPLFEDPHRVHRIAAAHRRHHSQPGRPVAARFRVERLRVAFRQDAPDRGAAGRIRALHAGGVRRWCRPPLARVGRRQRGRARRARRVPRLRARARTRAVVPRSRRRDVGGGRRGAGAHQPGRHGAAVAPQRPGRHGEIAHDRPSGPDVGGRRERAGPDRQGRDRRRRQRPRLPSEAHVFHGGRRTRGRTLLGRQHDVGARRRRPALARDEHGPDGGESRRRWRPARQPVAGDRGARRRLGAAGPGSADRSAGTHRPPPVRLRRARRDRPLRVRFRYMLEGFDRDWVDAGSGRMATYARLPARGYRFRVAATNGDGVWSDDAVLAFAVAPAFTQTRTFYALLACLAALVVLGSWRLHVRRVRREFAMVLAERVRLGRALHDTLLQGLAGMALQVDDVRHRIDISPATAKERLTRVRWQVEDYIRRARHSIWELRSPLLDSNDLSRALRRAAEEAVGERAVELSVFAKGEPTSGTPIVKENLVFIGQEAVSNAVRHGRPSRVTVTLDYQHNAVRLAIEDDGCGFEPHDVPGHYGLTGMRERAEHLRGRLTIDSAPGRGTRVETVVPIH